MFELLEDTDSSPVNTDIRGLTEEEVYEKEIQISNTPEPTPGSIIKEGVGHLRFNTTMGAWGEYFLDTYNQEYDPDFNYITALEEQGTPLESYNVANQAILDKAVNADHLMELQEQVADREAWKENTMLLGGVSRLTVDLVAEAGNIINYLPIIGAAQNISRIKRAAIFGLQGAGLAGAEEAAISLVYKDKTAADVVGGMLMGGTFAAGIGSIIKPSLLSKAQEEVSNSLHNIGKKLIHDNTIERFDALTKVPEGSAGAMRLDPYQELTGKANAQFRGDEVDPTIMDTFYKMIDKELPQMKGILRPDEIVGMGESLQRSGNPMSRYIGSLVLEHAEGTGGKVTAVHSADLKADIYFHQHAVAYSQDYVKNSNMFKASAKEYDVSKSFGNLVYKEINAQELGIGKSLSKKKNLKPWEQAVLNQSKRIQHYNSKLFKRCKDAGVTEFSTIKPNEFYLARQYDGKAFIRYANLKGKDSVVRMIQRSILSGDQFESKFLKAAKEGVEPPDMSETALNMAKAVFNRMSNRTIRTGADANILQTGNQKLLLSALEDVNIPHEQMVHIKAVLKSAGRDRFSNPNKSRISMNMQAEYNGMRMTDLLDTDLASGYLGHMRKWSGRAALAEKGFNDRGVFDKALHSMTQVGKSMDDSIKGLKKTQADFDRLSNSWDLIQGIPIDKDLSSGAKKGMRALRKLATASKLGKLVAAQATETNRMLSSIGVLRTLEGVPAFRNMIRDAKTGRMKDTLIQDLEDAGLGRIGDEYMLRHQDFRIDDLHENAFKGEKALDSINYNMAKYTGFNLVQTMQKRLFARQYAMKLWRDINANKLSTVQANDLGLDTRMVNLIKKEMNTHVEEIPGLGKRKVSNLHVRLWSPEARDAFIAVLHKKSSNAIQTINVGDIPLWAHRSFGQFCAQFRTFGLASAGKHGVHDYRMAKSGDLEGINAFLFSAMLAGAMYTAKTEVSSFGLDRRKRKKFLKNRLAIKNIAANSSNYISQFGFASDTGQFLLNGFAPGIMGDEISYARTGDVGTLLEGIPGIGYAGQALKGVSGISKALTSGEGISKADFRALWGTIPLNNTFGISNVRNLIENQYFE